MRDKLSLLIEVAENMGCDHGIVGMLLGLKHERIVAEREHDEEMESRVYQKVNINSCGRNTFGVIAK